MSEIADRERNARRYWARPNGGHDRFVSTARVVLPIGIGTVIAFLIASPLSKVNGDISFLLAKDSVDMANERLRVIEAVYRGKDKNGRSFMLTAGSAVQATSDEPVIRLRDVTARLDMAEGPSTVTAKTAEFDMDAEVIRIIGPVTYASADGYRLDLNNVSIGLKTRTVQSNGKAAGVSPRGNVAAGVVQANLDSKTAVLQGGVAGSTPKGRVTADSVQADFDNRTAVLQGGVTGDTPFGRYTAARAQLDVAGRTLILDQGVTGALRLGTFTAARMRANLGSRTVILDGGVKMHIKQGGL